MCAFKLQQLYHFTNQVCVCGGCAAKSVTDTAVTACVCVCVCMLKVYAIMCSLSSCWLWVQLFQFSDCLFPTLNPDCLRKQHEEKQANRVRWSLWLLLFFFLCVYLLTRPGNLNGLTECFGVGSDWEIHLVCCVNIGSPTPSPTLYINRYQINEYFLILIT